MCAHGIFFIQAWIYKTMSNCSQSAYRNGREGRGMKGMNLDVEVKQQPFAQIMDCICNDLKEGKIFHLCREYLGSWGKCRLRRYLDLLLMLKAVCLAETYTECVIFQQRQRWLWSTPPSGLRLMRHTQQRKKVCIYSVWSYISK